MHEFHVSREPNSADVCRWLGLGHIVYGFYEKKAIIERIMEHIRSWPGAFILMLNAFDPGGVYVEPTLAAYVI